jgi:hypothetical protein
MKTKKENRKRNRYKNYESKQASKKEKESTHSESTPKLKISYSISKSPVNILNSSSEACSLFFSPSIVFVFTVIEAFELTLPAPKVTRLELPKNQHKLNRMKDGKTDR